MRGRSWFSPSRNISPTPKPGARLPLRSVGVKSVSSFGGDPEHCRRIELARRSTCRLPGDDIGQAPFFDPALN